MVHALGPNELPPLDSASKGQSLFSLQKANEMLPLIESIVREVVELNQALGNQGEQLRGIRHLVEQAGAESQWLSHPMPDGHGEELEDVRLSIQADRKRLEECLGELSSLGIRLHRPIDGAVDFPGQMGSREIAWCWRLGESSVSHWHAPDADVGQRQAFSSVN